MSAYKLYYFDARGLAEPIRWIFAYTGVDYEDNRFPLVNSEGERVGIPADVKAKCPWGQVPILEHDGKVFSQSIAITRYLAKKLNLAGSNDYESFKCDEIADALKDLMAVWRPVFMEEDASKKETLKKDAIEKTNVFLERVNKIAKENGGKHLVGTSMTWSDFICVHYIKHFEQVFEFEIMKNYPEMTSVADNVANHPGIKEWLAKRPVTKY